MSNTDKILQDILAQLKQGNRTTGGNTGGNFGSIGTSLINSSRSVSDSLGFLGKGLNLASSGVMKFVNSIEEGLDPWRAAGKHGATFGNDVVGMALSATKARLNMGELAEIVRENTAGFAGLGGTVGKGAKAFTEMSQKFFETKGYADELRTLGYTNKELNDVLALQITMQRQSMKLDEVSQQKNLKSAHELAKEMDALARLTGKSREEQMASMKKLAADRQLESKFLLMKQQNPDLDIDAIRSSVIESINQLPDHLQTAAKEQFAMGTVASEEGAMAATLYGKEYSKIVQMNEEFKKGNVEAAKAMINEIRAASVESGKNASLLHLGTMNGEMGSVITSIHKMMDSTSGLRESVARLDSAAGGLKSAAEILKEAAELIKKEQDEAGKATGIYLSAQGRMTDIAAGAALALDKVYKSDSMTEILTKLDNNITTWKGNVMADGSIQSFAEGISKMAEHSLIELDNTTGEIKASLTTLSAGVKEFDNRVVIAGSLIQGTTDVIQGVTTAVNTLSSATGKVYDYVKDLSTNAVKKLSKEDTTPSSKTPEAAPGRSKGSLGETGNLFENWGSETLVRLHGVEGVVRPQDMENMAKGFKSEGYNLAFSKLANVMESVKLPILQPPEKPYSDFNPDFEKRFDGIEQTMSGTIADFEQMTSSVESSFSAIGDEAFKSFDDILETPGTIESKVASIGAVFGDVLGKITPEIQKTIKASSDTVFSIGKVLEKHSQAPQVPKDLRQQIELNIPKQSQSEQRQAEQPREIKSTDSIKQYQAPITIDKSSLTPIVENLEKLNIQVTSLIEQQADLARKQVSAIEKHSNVIR